MALQNSDRQKRRQRNKDIDEVTNRGQFKGRKANKKNKLVRHLHIPS